MNAQRAVATLLAIMLIVAACADRKLRPINPCTVTAVVQEVSSPGAPKVDLLFMIDDSSSMADEQAALAAQLENVVRVLLRGEIPGEDPFTPVESLRVGVIRSDMGVLGVGTIPAALPPHGTSLAINDCGTDAEGRFFGEDGAITRATSASPLPDGCLAEYSEFHQFDASTDLGTEEAFVRQVGCTALVGTGGCGMEMQLESILAAVTDSSRPGAPAFAPTVEDGAPRDRSGRATPGEPNAGFFRDDSVIAVVAITDEEDCSTDDPEMFMFSPSQSSLQDPAHSTDETGDFRVNTRCLFFADHLHGIERYVEGLRALRPAAPDRVVFAGIVGIPADLEDGADVLADPRMQYRDVIADGELQDLSAHWSVFTEPACFRCASDPSVTDWRDCPDDADANETGPNPDPDRNEDLQWAAPGRRYVELAQRLDEVGIGNVIRSICTDDFGPAMGAISSRIGKALRGACIPRPLHRDANERVPCDVVEILPVGETCATRVGAGRDATPVRIEHGTSGDREVCRVVQLPPSAEAREAGSAPEGLGWFYDDYTQTIADCHLAAGESRQRIGFTEGALPLPGAKVRLECLQPIEGDDVDGPHLGSPCTSDEQCAGTNAMRCEPSSRTCQIACESAAECPGGFTCASGYCLDPTCTVGDAV